MKLILLSPDWDSAANDLNKAAVCFKVNLSFLQNQHLLIRWLAVGRNVKLPTSEHVKLMPTLAGLKPNAAFSHFIRCLRSLYHAAKQLEGALLVCREQGRLEEVVQPNIKKYDIAAGGGPCQQRWPVIQTSWEPRVSCADDGEWLSYPDEYNLEKQQVSRSQRRNNPIYPTSYLGKSSQNSWTRNTRKCCVPLWESCWYCEYYSQYITLTKIMAFHEPVAENRWPQKIDHQRQLSI